MALTDMKNEEPREYDPSAVENLGSPKPVSCLASRLLRHQGLEELRAPFFEIGAHAQRLTGRNIGGRRGQRAPGLATASLGGPAA